MPALDPMCASAAHVPFGTDALCGQCITNRVGDDQFGGDLCRLPRRPPGCLLVTKLPVYLREQGVHFANVWIQADRDLKMPKGLFGADGKLSDPGQTQMRSGDLRIEFDGPRILHPGLFNAIDSQ